LVLELQLLFLSLGHYFLMQ